jgi:hypothetical protein
MILLELEIELNKIKQIISMLSLLLNLKFASVVKWTHESP